MAITIPGMDENGLQRVFDDAVVKIRADYLDETKNTTFLNLTGPDSQSQLYKWIKSTDPKFVKQLTTGQKVEHWMDSMQTALGEGFPLRDPWSGKSLVATSHLFDISNFSKDPAKQLLTMLYHESGHVIVEDGIYGASLKKLASGPVESFEQAHQGETRADNFAGGNGLRLGFLDKNDVRGISLCRATELWIGAAFIYATSPSIDAMLDTQDFANASAKDVKLFAAKNARDHKISGEELILSTVHVNKLNGKTGYDMPLLTRFKQHPQTWLKKITDAALAPESTGIALYAYAKILTAVSPAGKIDIPPERAFDTQSAFYDNARDVVAKKITALGMTRALVPAGPATP